MNSDLFNDVDALKEQVTTLSTSYLQTTEEHRTDISQNRQDISLNLSKINDISTNKIPNLILDISQNRFDISLNRFDISQNKADISKKTVDISHIYIYMYVCVCIYIYR